MKTLDDFNSILPREVKGIISLIKTKSNLLPLSLFFCYPLI